ncbi:DNA replication/repair protein RecF [Acuticoccus sp. MNP-M23]|uniref:DNA replication/repair protein RecF n=1 Tax=Acuticoccus sp. MNP-M23 TaxID=3072793 RepID=UPI0028162A97|nr:DNA replication/repair protein RecF [Acuticoccus sp. MNP-M23]WMS44875.1 DNA replication/repair protein RecF [Acuticoccus sp. MNP-M23]
MDTVRLTRLTLTDFRNYATATFETRAGHVVFTGPNGAGKTNILEAISLLSPGRGLRRATYAQMGRQGSLGRWAINARLAKDGEETGVGIGLPPGGSTRQVRIDGDDRRPDDLTDILRVLWLTPAMDGLFTGAATDRRRFLDRMALALYPDHGRRANAYERATRQRNKMFEDRVHDSGWFQAVEREMAEHGSALASHRASLVAQLNARQAERAKGGNDFPEAVLEITGDEGDSDGAAFAARLAERRERDRAACRALSGPHRADLDVLHRDKQMPAALASTGEQKALLIGLVLGHAALVARLSGDPPLLLLDEVAAHLDPMRRAALYDTLDGLGAQTFMTGTDPALFEALGARADRFFVAAGRIVAAPAG